MVPGDLVKRIRGRKGGRAKILLLLVIAAAVIGINPGRQCPDCNVVIISINDLRADHVGTYGYGRNTTPNIDRFARGSIVFENSITQAPWTLPSQVSFMTSLYASVHAIGYRNSSFFQRIKGSDVLLAEVMKDNGYKTAAFVATTPNIIGLKGRDDLSARYGFSRGFDTYVGGAGESFAQTIPLAAEWLKQNGEKKFFLFVQGRDVHAPFSTVKEFDNLFDPSYNGVMNDVHLRYIDLDCIKKAGNAYVFDCSNTSRIDGTPTIAGLPTSGSLNFTRKFINGTAINEAFRLSQRDMDHVAASYDGGIAYADYLLGDFFITLKNIGLLNKTIVIVVSDHGESLYERDSIGHNSLYDENVRVVTIIRNPKYPPERIKEVVQLIDVAPTILDFVGVPAEKSFQGNSMVPLIDGIGKEEFKYAYTEDYEGSVSVRTDKWKFILRIQGDTELYDLQNDPHEQVNVAENRRDAAQNMFSRISGWKMENTLLKNQ